MESRFRDNHILGSLDDSDLASLRIALLNVDVKRGTVLCEEKAKAHRVFFPIDAMISVVQIFSTGRSIEVGMVGYEGMAGIHVYLADGVQPHRLVVQGSGRLAVLDQKTFLDAFEASDQLRSIILRYTHTYIIQIAQSAGCNQVHTLNQRLARWLLSIQDRLKRDDLDLTHEFVAEMLGSRRAGITEALGVLDRRGVVGVRRNHVVVLNRAALLEEACECYTVTRAELNRYFESTRGRPGSAM